MLCKTMYYSAVGSFHWFLYCWLVLGWYVLLLDCETLVQKTHGGLGWFSQEGDLVLSQRLIPPVLLGQA